MGRCEFETLATTGELWYRIDRDAVLVVHVYAKKTRAMPGMLIEQCRRRLEQYEAAAKKPERKKDP